MPFLELEHLKVHYEAAGSDGTPLVLVHGNFASARWWRPTLERAPEGVRLLAPSARGCGDSQRLDDGYDLPQLARDLAGFATAAGLARLRLVGHSLGGAVAMQFAADFPERTEALLLVAPPPPAAAEVLKDRANPLSRILRSFDADDPKDVLMVKALFAWGQALGGHRRMLRRSLEEMLGGAHLPRERIDELLDDAARVPEAALLGFLSALQHWDVREQLARVQAPATVVWGEADPLIPREAAEAASRDFPRGSLLVWSGVGHSPMYEQPDEFASLLGAFARDEALPERLPRSGAPARPV